MGSEVAHEISLVNVDKPPLDFTDLAERAAQFAASEPLWITRAATFREKADVFPGATFIVSGIAQDFRGANNYRPNVTCDPMASGADRTITNWFNKACVVVPTDPSQPFGNAARNSVHGPLSWQFDFAASKKFALGGPAQLEFRLEAFNLLNRTNLRAPNGNRSAAGFGTITATNDPRQLQLGFKVLW